MIGLLFLGEALLWLFILKWVVKNIGDHLPARPWRPVVMLCIFVVMLPLPLLDEILGGWQFRHLCESNVVHVNKDTARGKTVFAESGAFQIRVPGTWVPVWKLSTRYLDATTQDVVVSYDQLWAEGGRLFPGFDSGHNPLTFKGECAPAGIGEKRFLPDLGVTKIDRPSPRSPETK